MVLEDMVLKGVGTKVKDGLVSITASFEGPATAELERDLTPRRAVRSVSGEDQALLWSKFVIVAAPTSERSVTDVVGMVPLEFSSNDHPKATASLTFGENGTTVKMKVEIQSFMANRDLFAEQVARVMKMLGLEGRLTTAWDEAEQGALGLEDAPLAAEAQGDDLDMAPGAEASDVQNPHSAIRRVGSTGGRGR